LAGVEELASRGSAARQQGFRTTGSEIESRRGRVRLLPLSSVRKDGNTQNRFRIDPELVAQYAALMGEGVEFPPVRVWWDGAAYWLSDGFHRVAAAELAGLTEVVAEVFTGDLHDAQWDSYSANTRHGSRLTREETRRVMLHALQHPSAAKMSTMQIARWLHIPEATVRRARRQLSSSSDEDGVRLVSRGNRTYAMRTSNIGKGRTTRRLKTQREMRTDLLDMKGKASADALRLLAVVEKWVVGNANSGDTLEAVERIIRTLRADAAAGSSNRQRRPTAYAKR